MYVIKSTVLGYKCISRYFLNVTYCTPNLFHILPARVYGVQLLAKYQDFECCILTNS
jgi:hypothetical protein